MTILSHSKCGSSSETRPPNSDDAMEESLKLDEVLLAEDRYLFIIGSPFVSSSTIIY